MNPVTWSSSSGCFLAPVVTLTAPPRSPSGASGAVETVTFHWFGPRSFTSSFSGTGARDTRRKEFGASAFVGLKSGSSDTRMTSADAASPESAVIRKKAYGSASTNGFTMAERKSVFWGTAGSSVMRSAVFEIGPGEALRVDRQGDLPLPARLDDLVELGNRAAAGGLHVRDVQVGVARVLEDEHVLDGVALRDLPDVLLVLDDHELRAAGLGCLRLGGERRREGPGPRARLPRARKRVGTGGGKSCPGASFGNGSGGAGTLKNSKFVPWPVYVGPPARRDTPARRRLTAPGPSSKLRARCRQPLERSTWSPSGGPR